MEIVSDPVEKRKNFGMTMPVKLDAVKQDPLQFVDTIGLPIYSKETKKEFLEYCKRLEESVMQYKSKYNELKNDHDILYKSYIMEITRSSKIEHAFPVLRRIANKLANDDGVLC
jgi:hypothetical protein